MEMTCPIPRTTSYACQRCGAPGTIAQKCWCQDLMALAAAHQETTPLSFAPLHRLWAWLDALWSEVRYSWQHPSWARRGPAEQDEPEEERHGHG